MMRVVIILMLVIGCGFFGFGIIRLAKNKDVRKNKNSYDDVALSALLGMLLLFVAFVINTFVLH